MSALQPTSTIMSPKYRPEWFLPYISSCAFTCRNKVIRLIAITSWCTQPGPNNPWFIEWFLKPFIIGASLRDMAIMEQLLQDTNPDEINYTVVKPPGLSLGRWRILLITKCIFWPNGWHTCIDTCLLLCARERLEVELHLPFLACPRDWFSTRLKCPRG